MSEPHCNGCGRPGRLPDGLIWTSEATSHMPPFLTRLAASIWPDGRERLLCPRCRKKLLQHMGRLERSGNGWGYLT
jgi:hypothetical protein